MIDVQHVEFLQDFEWLGKMGLPRNQLATCFLKAPSVFEEAKNKGYVFVHYIPSDPCTTYLPTLRVNVYDKCNM